MSIWIHVLKAACQKNSFRGVISRLCVDGEVLSSTQSVDTKNSNRSGGELEGGSQGEWRNRRQELNLRCAEENGLKRTRWSLGLARTLFDVIPRLTMVESLSPVTKPTQLFNY